MMMENLSDAEFVKEFQILWQKSGVKTRNKLARIIRSYFNEGDRAERIIARLQETL